MRFAIVEGLKCEPEPKLRGLCPGCGNEVVSKCGEKVIWHWAHLSKVKCDHWWENETEWHRDWKDQFSKEEQEVVCFADDGEKHIADVKLKNGFVLEFQHSPIQKVEVIQRNNFYQDIIWIVNGLRRAADYSNFCTALKNGQKINNIPLTFIVKIDSHRLFEDWGRYSKPIFIDFSEEDLILGKTLWLLLPTYDDEKVQINQVYFPDLLVQLKMNSCISKLGISTSEVSYKVQQKRLLCKKSASIIDRKLAFKNRYTMPF